MIIKHLIFDPILIDSRFFRRGILLKMRNEEGQTVSSEISPLPGHSKETLEEAFYQLQTIKRDLQETNWSLKSLHTLKNFNLFSSVYFGIESALLQLLNPHPLQPCQSYALLLGQTAEEILQRAHVAQREGFHEAKVKIGHLHPEAARPLLNELVNMFNLRIDLNRRWQNERVFSFFKDWSSDQLIYVEEPLKDLDELDAFPLPFALDESLREQDPAPFLELKNFHTIIIKPTVQYPFDSLMHLEKKIVLTSSFEGTVGINQIRSLISRLNLSHTLHGLDTLRYFQGSSHDSMSYSLLEKALP